MSGWGDEAHYVVEVIFERASKGGQDLKFQASRVAVS